MDPKISIIIPAHNEENYIRKTLHSIKNQTYQIYETVVVANGCTDGTEDLVKKRTNDKTIIVRAIFAPLLSLTQTVQR